MNDSGTSFSEKLHMAVCIVLQWEWTTPLKDITVKETEPALFECEFSVPNVNVTWSVKGEPIEASPKYGIKSDGKKHSLDVAKCRPTDVGEVSCTFKDYTTRANLTVEGKKNNNIAMFVSRIIDKVKI